MSRKKPGRAIHLVPSERGISLIELLVGVLCFALIVTFVTRVFASSIEAVQRDSLGRLVRLHRAASVYRFEADGNWPTRDAVLTDHLGFGEDFFVSPCSNSTGYLKRKSGISYLYLWTHSRAWVYDDESVKAPLFVDLDCNRTHSPEANTPKVGLGVTAAGETIVLKKKGDPRRWSWWLAE